MFYPPYGLCTQVALSIVFFLFYNACFLCLFTEPLGSPSSLFIAIEFGISSEPGPARAHMWSQPGLLTSLIMKLETCRCLEQLNRIKQR